MRIRARLIPPLSAVALTAALCTGTVLAKSSAQWQQLATQSKLTLSDAIERAVQTIPGNAIDAELESGDVASAHYEVEIITPNGENVEVWVDAVSGQTAQHKNDGKAKRKDLRLVDDARASMLQAIRSATVHTPGTAIGAELERHWGKTSYQVNVLQADGALMEVTVDAADAQVIRAKRD